jgi:ribosome maturation factor RimP
MSRDRVDHLTRLISEVLSGTDYELVDVELAAQGRRTAVRVFVDSAKGVGLDDCSRVTRLLGDHLDAAEDLGLKSYVLEVSSPGVDRPLRRAEDFTRFSGETAAVTTRGKIHGRANHLGRIVEVIDGLLTLDQPDAGPTEIPLNDILKAHLKRDPWDAARRGR